MRFLIWLTTVCLLSLCLPARALELRPLAECSIKVFRDINSSHVWSGKPADGCMAEIYVEKRPAGIFVTTWINGGSEGDWERVSLSVAMSYREVANRQALEKAGRDILSRAGRIERCLDSIIRVNDPLECRDRATKTYSAGEEMGVELSRYIWLDDNGRHSVVEYAHGDTSAAVKSAPADLFSGPALPPGTNLNIHIFDSE